MSRETCERCGYLLGEHRTISGAVLCPTLRLGHSELFIAKKLDQVLGALENYKMRVEFIHRKAHDAEGFKRELRLDEMRRIEAAAIEARDALRELLR